MLPGGYFTVSSGGGDIININVFGFEESGKNRTGVTRIKTWSKNDQLKKQKRSSAKKIPWDLGYGVTVTEAEASKGPALSG